MYTHPHTNPQLRFAGSPGDLIEIFGHRYSPLTWIFRAAWLGAMNSGLVDCRA